MNNNFAPYIVNTNTSTIYKHTINLAYKSKEDCIEDGEDRLKSQVKKTQYVKVRSNRKLDYKKTVPDLIVKKWISQKYCIPCRNYNQALYRQAVSRTKKSKEIFDLKTGKMIDMQSIYIKRLNEMIDRISKDHPEDLI